jgi:hypothetical protein
MNNYTAFFTDNKKHFFRPLNSKYREIILGCLRALYHRLYSPEADFGYQVTREEMRDLFVQVIRETPVLADDDEEEIDQKATDDRAKANAIFQELLNCGWLEKYVDNMSSTYRFTRAGKAFSETIAGFETKGLKTRQRNVRNTKNALQAFLNKNDPFDLIDAVDYAKRVASDFADDIADLHERKQALMKDAIQKAQFAIQDLLDYMDNHFSPDLAIRLSADSIVRHHNDIREIVEKIKKPWRLKKLKRTEKTLKSLVPGKTESTSDTPIIYQLLDQIERYLESAERVKMSELRAALESYVGRTTLLIKQATAMMAGLKEEQLAKTLQTLSKSSPEQQNQQLALIGQHLGTLSARLIAPNTVSLRKRERREVPDEIKEASQPTPEERLQAALAEAEDNAFTISMDDIRQEILKQMGEQWTIRVSELKITNAATFLALSHAIEVGSASLAKEKPRLLIEPTEERFINGYLETDDYIIRKG